MKKEETSEGEPLWTISTIRCNVRKEQEQEKDGQKKIIHFPARNAYFKEIITTSFVATQRSFACTSRTFQKLIEAESVDTARPAAPARAHLRRRFH